MKNKWMFISLIVVAQTALSGLRTDASERTKPITGYEPFMSSIGTIINLDQSYIYDSNNNPVLTDGGVLFVPSGLCNKDIFENNQSLLPYFNFIDFDKDLCKSTQFDDLKWYILKSANWDTVSNWDDLEKIEIIASQFQGALIVPESNSLSAHTHILKIPTESIGHRIGFTYLPKTETGNPNVGQEIKVWDLNYFFSQKEPSSAGKSLNHNDGEKLTRTTMPEQKEIFASQAKPVITQLFMQGEFSTGSQLTAVYDVSPESVRSHEIEMRFWWGKKNTTIEKAYFQNPDYLSTNQSPVLTEEQIGSVIEVSALPIRLDSGLKIVGDVKTVDSLNSENILYQPPSISDLIMSNTPLVKNSISATYKFDNGGYPDSIDKSTYRWQYQSNGELKTIQEGEILNSGFVPEIVSIESELVGSILKLSVEPKDNFDRKGQTETISNEIIGIENIEVNYPEVNFILGKAETVKMDTTIYFSDGTTEMNPNSGKFEINDSNFTIDQYGNLTFDHNLRNKVNGILKYKYLNKEVQIALTADFGQISIENAYIVNGLIESQPIVIGYQFNNGWIAEAKDLSTYELFILERNEFKSIEQGEVKNSGKIETIFKIRAIDKESEFRLEIKPRDQLNREGPVKIMHFSPNPLD